MLPLEAFQDTVKKGFILWKNAMILPEGDANIKQPFEGVLNLSTDLQIAHTWFHKISDTRTTRVSGE